MRGPRSEASRRRNLDRYYLRDGRTVGEKKAKPPKIPKPAKPPKPPRPPKLPKPAKAPKPPVVKVGLKELRREDYPSEQAYSTAVRKRRWKLENREQHVADSHNQRAKKAGVVGKLTGADIKAQLAVQDGVCFYCPASLEGGYHVEHVIPMSRGGANSPENIACACAACNLSKHAKTPEEWKQSA